MHAMNRFGVLIEILTNVSQLRQSQFDLSGRRVHRYGIETRIESLEFCKKVAA